MAVFRNAGQDRCARSRILVEASILDEFMVLLEEPVKAVRVGNPLDETTQNGIADHLDSTRDGGVLPRRRCAGGDPRQRSRQPRLLACSDRAVPRRSRLARGPRGDLWTSGDRDPIQDEQDAIRLANDTIYGLSGSIWTRDGARALRVARAVDAGVLSINSNTSVRVTTPFGGFKQSGYGRELGPHALDAYAEVKSMFYSSS